MRGGASPRYLIALPIRFWKSCTKRASWPWTVGADLRVPEFPVIGQLRPGSLDDADEAVGALYSSCVAIPSQHHHLEVLDQIVVLIVNVDRNEANPLHATGTKLSPGSILACYVQHEKPITQHHHEPRFLA